MQVFLLHRIVPLHLRFCDGTVTWVLMVIWKFWRRMNLTMRGTGTDAVSTKVSFLLPQGYFRLPQGLCGGMEGS